MDEDPRTLYQANLDAVSRAIWDEDWDRMLRYLAIPNTMAFRNGRHVFETPEDMVAAAQRQRESFRRHAADDWHRLCRAARYDGPDKITGHHVSFVLRGATYRLEPFTSRMTLQRIDGRWLSAGCDVDIDDTDLRILPRPRDAVSAPS
ncbi:MAG: hypothetical protein AAF914_03645 [Pseudomonadota bacterium]